MFPHIEHLFDFFIVVIIYLSNSISCGKLQIGQGFAIALLLMNIVSQF